jgi:hypothetical protein
LAFTPEGSSELLERIRLLQVGPELRKKLGSNGRAAVETSFRRTKLARRMLKAIENCVADNA